MAAACSMRAAVFCPRFSIGDTGLKSLLMQG
jgi:hypothetical protein